MHVLLVYDITDDRKRAKIADICLDYGLDRIQMSAFTGRLNRNLQEELMLKLGHVLNDAEGNIQLFPIDVKAWEKRLVIGHDE